MHAGILAIDQGTTATTCLAVAYTPRGPQIVGRGVKEIAQHFPEPSWVEHDLEDIWRSVETSAQAALQQAGWARTQVHAIGITNQRETVAAWYPGGQPAHRAIVWQDRRTAAACAALTAAGHEADVRKRTGLRFDPYFSGTKMAWLLQEKSDLQAAAAAGRLLFGTIDSWLIYRLTGGVQHLTDVTNASRTLLFNIHEMAWDAHLCALLQVPQSALPEVRSNCASFGVSRGVAWLADGVPISGVAGDQQAALIGQGCVRPGLAKCTYGTGAFALVHTGESSQPSAHGLLRTVAYQVGDSRAYALEGSVFVAGAVVQWLRDGLGMFGESADVETLAAQVPDSGGVVVVPALTGLGAPHWRPQARGLIDGLTRGSNRAHVARAALEGIAFQVYDLLVAMRSDSGVPFTELRVDGGAAANALLMQFQADLLQMGLHRPQAVDSTALGAAHLAALGSGVLDSLAQIGSFWAPADSFMPRASKAVVTRHLQRWQAALAKV